MEEEHRLNICRVIRKYLLPNLGLNPAQPLEVEETPDTSLVGWYAIGNSVLRIQVRSFSCHQGNEVLLDAYEGGVVVPTVSIAVNRPWELKERLATLVASLS